MKKSESKAIDMMEKQEKKELITEIDIYSLEGNLERAIEILSDARDSKYLKSTVNIYLDDEGDGPYGYLEIYGVRLETDEEVTKRMEDHAKRELAKYVADQKKIEDEKRLLKELSEKYKDEVLT